MSHLRAVFLMILVALLWSTAGVVTRHLDSAASFEVTFWRSGFNALTLAIVLTVLRGPGLWRGLLHAPGVIWGSGICWGTMFTAFMVAITLTTVANVLITLAIGPLLTALFARIFLKHRLTPATWLAIAVATLGIIWMFRQEGDNTLSLAGTLVALAVPFAGAVNFTILQHVGLKRERVMVIDGQPLRDMLPSVLIGAMLSALATLPLAWPFRASVHDLVLLSLLGIFQLAIPCLLVVRLSRELPAPEISLLAQLEVVFGVTWAWLWAGEEPSANTLSGGILVLCALVANEMARLYGERSARRSIPSAPGKRRENQ
jgi:drug/metabolite transporter (DMT)-like permease